MRAARHARCWTGSFIDDSCTDRIGETKSGRFRGCLASVNWHLPFAQERSLGPEVKISLVTLTAALVVLSVLP